MSEGKIVKLEQQRLMEFKLRDSLAFESKGTFIEDVLGNRNNLLCFVFTESNCGPCLESELEVFSRYYSGLNAVIITDYPNRRILDQLLSNYGISNIEIYKKTHYLTLDKTNIPYYLILDNYNTVKDIFIPIKARPDITEQFLKIINKKNKS